MKAIKKLICRLKGHKFDTAKQYLLPARQCRRCGLHQVELPYCGSESGGWINCHKCAGLSETKTNTGE